MYLLSEIPLHSYKIILVKQKIRLKSILKLTGNAISTSIRTSVVANVILMIFILIWPGPQNEAMPSFDCLNN